ncbi:MAG: pyruvate decarboxylase [Gammaproteobacteria bacterium RIFOXYA12_FULL_61_12]|nr:MAG: pyruvate decarboxylase [Gammaproteobacteria bacterium RIFOXYD12_FULL_61_37]OGT93244.1 MAG: pyruvate decarboxylase [Gammaproteobacteria bacterium RIFOXYA12_FULL_61_12]
MAHASPDSVSHCPPPSEWPRIGGYLLARLKEAGVDHVFGVPGDYILRFYDSLIHSDIQHVGTTREDTAAFAADAYARCRGLGAVAVTYGVGALNTVNAVAGANAEHAPVVVISGAPGVDEQRDDPLLHHRFGPFSFQREIFDRITCAGAVLDDPFTALRQIDRVLAAARRHSRPVYIELPRDRVDAVAYPYPREAAEVPASDPAALGEAVAETLELLRQAQAPAVLAGVEVQRRRLQDLLARFLLKARLPVAATLTGKSVVGERHPAYAGVYEGAMGAEGARNLIEQADLLLLLGVTLNDVDLGIYTARLNPERMVRADQGEVRIHHHCYPSVHLRDFLDRLAAAVTPHGTNSPVFPGPPGAADFPQAGRPITIDRLVARLNGALTPAMQIVADTGDCLFAALELRVHERSEFLASAFYTTMGYAVPAALGAQMARPELRPLVLVGDGAFQMTGTELATAARLGLDPIVILFNNAGYTTERFILEGPFNDISNWRFHRLGELFGPLRGFEAATEEAFEQALQAALVFRDGPSVIDVRLRPDDTSMALRRLSDGLKARVAGG